MGEYTCVVEGVVTSCTTTSTLGQVQALGILDPFVGLAFTVAVILAVSLGLLGGYVLGGGHR